ncbi:MAG: ATP-binding cassette domain-containing protein, partial [Rhodobacteraceae bacterium]|nr:ATP-binding cassette domain-containing protein [Paracoccaceae bacterium]
MVADTDTDRPPVAGAVARPERGGAPPPALRLSGVSKTFGGVQALRSVDFEVRQGEVHCLAGENGCGKSTLIKIVTGVYTPDAGAG